MGCKGSRVRIPPSRPTKTSLSRLTPAGAFVFSADRSQHPVSRRNARASVTRTLHGAAGDRADGLPKGARRWRRRVGDIALQLGPLGAPMKTHPQVAQLGIVGAETDHSPLVLDPVLVDE